MYVANLGDSRAVSGYSNRLNKIVAEQLTQDDDASMKEIRRELKDQHPRDSWVRQMMNWIASIWEGKRQSLRK